MKKFTILLTSLLTATSLTPQTLNATAGGGAAVGPANAHNTPTHVLVTQLEAQVETLNQANRDRIAAFALPNPDGAAIDLIYNHAKDKVFLVFLLRNSTLINLDILNDMTVGGFMPDHHNWAEFVRRQNLQPIDRLEYMSGFYDEATRQNPMYNEYIRRLHMIAQ